MALVWVGNWREAIRDTQLGLAAICTALLTLVLSGCLEGEDSEGLWGFEGEFIDRLHNKKLQIHGNRDWFVIGGEIFLRIDEREFTDVIPFPQAKVRKGGYQISEKRRLVLSEDIDQQHFRIEHALGLHMLDEAGCFLRDIPILRVDGCMCGVTRIKTPEGDLEFSGPHADRSAPWVMWRNHFVQRIVYGKYF